MEKRNPFPPSIVTLGPQKRYHFHLSSPDLAREPLGTINAPEVTSKDMVKAMMVYVWPKDDEKIKQRVLISLGLLAGGKILNVCVPFLFKAAVDHINVLNTTTISSTAMATTTSILIGCK